MEVIGLRELDPKELEIDPVNERVSNVGFHTEKDEALVGSIKEMGVTTPIVVRKKDKQKYVVAGQRRTLAAREADVDLIPALVYDMDDQEAKIVSVTENADQYDKDVPAGDRAEAIDSLLNDGMNIGDIADLMGVSKQTIERWWEPARDYWVGTQFEADTKSGDSPLDSLSLTAMQIIRENTADTRQSTHIAKKVIEHNVNVSHIIDAKKTSSSPKEFENNINKSIVNLKRGVQQVKERVRFTGEEASELEKIMKNRGVNEKEAIEMLVEERLEQLQSVDDGELLLLYLPSEITESIRKIIAGTNVNEEAFCRQVIKEKLKSAGYI